MNLSQEWVKTYFVIYKQLFIYKNNVLFFNPYPQKLAFYGELVSHTRICIYFFGFCNARTRKHKLKAISLDLK